MRAGWWLPVTMGVLAAGAPFPDPVDLTLEEGTHFAVALSPNSNSLVMDLQGTLWRLPPGGGDAEPLSDGMGDDRLPDWSPDGSRLAFQSFRTGSWDIWMVGADGAEPRPLTRGPHDDREPVWSPDGSRVAFSSDRSGSYDIWVLEVENGEMRQVTRQPSNEFMPTWSPDGTTLAFVSDRGQDGTGELWRIRIESGEEERIVSVAGRIASPSWSPDGTRILFQRTIYRPVTLMGTSFDEGVSSDLLSVSLRNREVTPLSEGEDVFPFRASWVRRGGVFYTADGKIRRLPSFPARGGTTPPSEVVPFRVRIHLERPSYRRQRPRLPELGSRYPVRGIVRPNVSPDGSLIAFTALGDLWIVSSEGGAPIALTRDEYLDSDPAWSPDSRSLVFSSDRDGTMDLWVKEIESAPRSGERRLTELPGAEIRPSWSPDGRWIAYLDEQDVLSVIPSEGGSPRPLYEGHRGVGTPSWSPDGRFIALAVHHPVSSRFREGANRIAVVSVATGETRLLTEPRKSFGTRDGDGPVWSPDGKQMAFAMDGGLWVLAVNEEGEPVDAPRLVVNEAADFPSWSPDVRSIFFLASDRLKQVDLETGVAREVPFHLEYRTPPAPGRLVIAGARLVDGTGAPPREQVDIVIEGDRVAAIVSTGGPADDGARIYSARGKTVVPGLIEMHMHPSLPAWGSRQGRVFLAFGVTSVRSPAAPAYRLLEERESIVGGRRLGPRVFLTGASFDGDRVYYTDALAVDDTEELERELDRVLRLELDLIKAYVRLPDILQKTLIERAHQRGLFVTSHELYPAVAYGVDGIEHIWGTSRRGFSPKITQLRRSYRDVVELAARSGAFLTPTLLIYGGYELALSREPALLQDPRLELFPPWATEKLRSPEPVAGGTEPASGAEREAAMQPFFDTVAALAAADGRLVAGTDAPLVPYGLSLLLEIEQMSEAGLGPARALESATRVAADALGVAAHLGTVEAGKLADLLIVDGNPDQDIRALRRVEAVVLNGRLLEVSQLLATAATADRRH